MPVLRIAMILLVITLTPPVSAEVVTSSDTSYVLRQEAKADMPPEELWARLINPASWWNGDHSYSGDAANLSLDIGPGR